MRKTYKDRPELPVRLVQLLNMVSYHYFVLNRFEECAEVTEEMIKIMKPLGTLSCYHRVMVCYEKMHKHKKAKKIANKAFEALKIQSGIEKSTFMKIYPFFGKYLV